MGNERSVVIDNGVLKLTAACKGAEMTSVVCAGTERIWCADPEVWGRHAPLLFPFIGRLRNGSYELEGRTIEAPRHGFCRDREFEIVESDADSITLRTREDEESLKSYPFPFRLDVHYRLEGNSVEKTLIVENVGDRDLPFEIGGHEAYSTALAPNETMADWRVKFEGAEGLSMFGMDEEGILTLPKTKVPLQEGCLDKTPEQLGIDTVIIEDAPGRTATLECAKTGRGVTVEFPDFPYLGIWTKPTGSDALFLCIEPWSALPDAHFSPRELSLKPGVISLAPGEARTLSYRMTFF